MSTEKYSTLNLEDYNADLGEAKMASTKDAARMQIESEHKMTLKEGLTTYSWAVFWSFAVSLTVIMDGYCITLVNSFFGFPQFVAKYGTNVDGEIILTASMQTALTATAAVGNIIGVLVSAELTDRIGHIRVMLCSMCALIGTVFMFVFAPNIGVLIGATVINGIPAGVFSVIAPAYASEVCPVVLRGYLTSYTNLCFIIGQLLSQGVLRGCLSIQGDNSFRIPFSIQWAFIPVCGLSIFFAPDSPWWHVRHNREEKAVKMFKRLRNDTDDEYANQAVSMMIHTNELEKEAQEGATYLDCFKRIDLRRTEISCLTNLCQPITLGNIMAYCSYFFQSAGLPVSQSFNLSIGLYCIGFVGTILSWVIIFYMGRRDIYLLGIFAIGFLFLIMGFVDLVPEGNTVAPWVEAVLLLVIVFIYDMSVGPICFSLISEMSAMRLRAKTVSLSRGSFQAWGILNGVIYPLMMNTNSGDWKGKIGFFQFGMCMICLLWAFFRLPEPSGRTYEEMDIMFMKKLPARKFKNYIVDIDNTHSHYQKDESNMDVA